MSEDFDARLAHDRNALLELTARRRFNLLCLEVISQILARQLAAGPRTNHEECSGDNMVDANAIDQGSQTPDASAAFPDPLEMCKSLVKRLSFAEAMLLATYGVEVYEYFLPFDHDGDRVLVPRFDPHSQVTWDLFWQVEPTAKTLGLIIDRLHPPWVTVCPRDRRPRVSARSTAKRRRFHRVMTRAAKESDLTSSFRMP